MTNTKTKIPAGLQVFTDSITTEQLKQVEEAIKEQNAAIDNLSKKLENAISSINKQKPQSPEGLSKAELKTAVGKYVSDFTGKFAEIMKNYLASFRGEVTTLRKERQAEHQELLDQRAHQHKVFIRIIIAIPTAALLILFSSGYLHYRNSAVYWGNRAYNAAKAAGATNPGAYYQYVQEHFQDSLKQTARINIRRLENTRSHSQK
ncbi:MAG: hypothetical protein MJY89_08925 [Bacteroidales bacterium]|nr:hypothetical protein [Bacteroidales bacterium]